MREVTCPSCGAVVKFVSAASLLAVCPYCRATLINRDLKIENVGKMGALLADPTPLQLGVEGKYRDVHFAVVGRIQVRYEDGAWNEWYLAFDDGRAGWLGEAMGTYSVSFETRQKVALPAWETVKPGLAVHIGGFDYDVSDVRAARVVGGEGELPFVVASGYEARVADLRTTTARFATLDYSENAPRIYLGEIVKFGALALSGLREQAPTGPSATGQALACSQCGAALTVRAPGKSLAVVCSACGAVLAASDPDARIIQEAAKRKTYEPAVPLGARGRFRGDLFEAVGFLVREGTSGDTVFWWNEYVLFNPAQGFRWLSEYQGHWILSKAVSAYPKEAIGGSQAPIRYLGVTYNHFQTVQAKVAYVEGEFPWRVQVGEKAEVADYVDPPRILSGEKTANEQTWSIGEHVDGETVWKAFGLKETPPAVEGVGVVQPSPYAPLARALGVPCLMLAGAALAIHLAFVLFSQDRKVYESRFLHTQNVTKAVVTEPFELTGRRSNVRIDLDTDLQNNWGYFNLALINEATGQALNFGREVSYYYGVDGGESWSEGGRRDDVFLPSVAPGRYYLLIDPEMAGGRMEMNYTVRVWRDVLRHSYLLWAWAVLAAPFLAVWGMGLLFEHKRWQESDHAGSESDDDGD